MFKEYDHVRIKSNGITGIIVDISPYDGEITVEDDVQGRGCPEGEWAWIRCKEEDLEKID